MLQDGGQGDRGAHYALTVATLKRKAEDLQQQIDALQLAETSLLQAAQEEAANNRAKAETRQAKRSKQAIVWGQALANAVASQAKEASDSAAEDEPPYSATELAHEAQKQVAETLEAHNKAQM